MIIKCLEEDLKYFDEDKKHSPDFYLSRLVSQISVTRSLLSIVYFFLPPPNAPAMPALNAFDICFSTSLAAAWAAACWAALWAFWTIPPTAAWAIPAPGSLEGIIGGGRPPGPGLPGGVGAAPPGLPGTEGAGRPEGAGGGGREVCAGGCCRELLQLLLGGGGSLLVLAGDVLGW